jgi:hypothetical protein
MFRRHHIWLLVAVALMLLAWVTWNGLLVEADLAR